MTLLRVSQCTISRNLEGIEKAVKWLNDPDVNKYLEARNQLWDTERWQRWYREQKVKGRIIFWILSEEEIVGTLALGPLEDKNAAIGLMVGKEHWGKGIGTKAIEEAAEYAFGKLGLHKVWAGVLSENTHSVRSFERAGFSIEGILRQNRRWGEGWCDEIRVARIGR